MPTDKAAAYVIGMGLMQALAHAAPDVPQREISRTRRALPPPLPGAPERPEPVRRRAADAGRAEGPPPLAGGGHRQSPGAGWTRCCTRCSCKGVFDGSRTADETAGKPHPLMLQELMREFGTEPERTLMIGDTTHDLQMAFNAGLRQRGRELRRARTGGLRRAEAAVRGALGARTARLAAAERLKRTHDGSGPALQFGRPGRRRRGRAVRRRLRAARPAAPSRSATRARSHAYLNRCAHVAMEMDWQPNRFFDDTGRWLLCGTHGAVYQPDTGACAGGPCRGGLVKIALTRARRGGALAYCPQPPTRRVPEMTESPPPEFPGPGSRPVATTPGRTAGRRARAGSAPLSKS